MTPDARRRLAGALMTEQYNRPTPQDTEVVERGGLVPFGTYANGMTGPAIPGFIYDGLFGPGDAASGKLGNYQDNREEWAKVGFDTAGAAMVGGLAAPRPRGSIGMSGRPEGFETSTLRHNNHNSTVTVIDDYNRPYGNPGTQPKVTSDQAAFKSTLTDPHTPAFNLVQRSDGSGEYVWPHTEREEALQRSLGARAAPDLYANGGKQGAATGAAINSVGERQSIGMSGRPEGAFNAKGPRPEPGALIPETEATGASQVLAETVKDVPRATWMGNSPYERADEVATALRQAIPSYSFEVIRSGSAAGNSAYVRTPMGDIRISDHGAHPKPGVFWQGDESSKNPEFFVGLVRDRMNETANKLLQGRPPNTFGSPRPNWMTADEWRKIYNRNQVNPVGDLYANGGRPGAAVGAVSTADIVRALMEDDANKYRGAI